MTENELLFAVLEDKIDECENNNYISHTSFLDSFEQSRAIQFLAKRGVRYTLYDKMGIIRYVNVLQNVNNLCKKFSYI